MADLMSRLSQAYLEIEAPTSTIERISDAVPTSQHQENQLHFQILLLKLRESLSL